MKSKQPAAAPGGRGNMAAALELASVFTHRGRQGDAGRLKEFSLALDKGGLGDGEAGLVVGHRRRVHKEEAFASLDWFSGPEFGKFMRKQDSEVPEV